MKRQQRHRERKGRGRGAGHMVDRAQPVKRITELNLLGRNYLVLMIFLCNITVY